MQETDAAINKYLISISYDFIEIQLDNNVCLGREASQDNSYKNKDRSKTVDKYEVINITKDANISNMEVSTKIESSFEFALCVDSNQQALTRGLL